MEFIYSFVDTFEYANQNARWVLVAYFGLIGALFASFGGLLVDRLPHQLEWIETADPSLKIWAPRSRCDECGRTLSTLSIIPVIGWLCSRGKCGNCGHRVSVKHPACELGMAIVFATIFAFVPDVGMALTLMLFVWVAFVISLLDLRHHWIPAVFTTPMLWLGLLVSPFEPDVMQRVIGAASAGLIIWGSFMMVAAISGRQLLDLWSGGDVAFLMMAGGWFGAEKVIHLIFLGAALFIVHERVVFMRTGERWVPFGPSLSAAFLTVAALQVFGLDAAFW